MKKPFREIHQNINYVFDNFEKFIQLSKKIKKSKKEQSDKLDKNSNVNNIENSLWIIKYGLLVKLRDYPNK